MITLVDGPLGTELIARGVPLDSDQWSAEALSTAPDLISQIHAEYLSAGAQVHTANTFRTGPTHCGTRWRELTQQAVSLVNKQIQEYKQQKSAKGTPADSRPSETPRRGSKAGPKATNSTASDPKSQHRLAGSIGPVADCYRPDLSPGLKSQSEHRELAHYLAQCGCDILFCETFANSDEAVTAVREAAKTGHEAWVSLTAGPETNLMSPRAMATLAARCVENGAASVVVGCTPATSSLNYLREIEKLNLGVALGVIANAGPINGDYGWHSVIDRENMTTTADATAAQRYADLAQHWVDHGATLIGACCGCSPQHIAALANRLK
ncbi:MAG: homocysteine S-methyltransferase family protein [Rubripirellula sp.]|nr:homocysteine S-methyltransferase family protein [Rubripirellula sp.]